MKLHLTFPVALLAAVLPARADVVVMTDGTQVEGRVTDHGDELSIAMRFGEMRVPRARVRMIERKSSLEERYEAKLAKLDLRDAGARVALGEWLEAERWGTQARCEYRRALEIDPEHGGAHLALGHVLHEGRWRSEREVMELRGLVRMGGEWVTPQEAGRRRSSEERARARKEELRARRALERRLNSLIRDVALGSQCRCDAAYEELAVIARDEQIEGLEPFVIEVKQTYDRYWKLVRQERDALVETRLTKTTLKRPIRNFQTGLGGGSSPVTLQLPEVSVISIRTTVVIPAGRGRS